MSRATGSCVETRHRLVEDFSNKTKITLLPSDSTVANRLTQFSTYWAACDRQSV